MYLFLNHCNQRSRSGVFFIFIVSFVCKFLSITTILLLGTYLGLTAVKYSSRTNLGYECITMGDNTSPLLSPHPSPLFPSLSLFPRALALMIVFSRQCNGRGPLGWGGWWKNYHNYDVSNPFPNQQHIIAISGSILARELRATICFTTYTFVCWTRAKISCILYLPPCGSRLLNNPFNMILTSLVRAQGTQTHLAPNLPGGMCLY